MNRMVITIVALFILGHMQTALAVSSASDGNRSTGSSSGVTVGDLGRGLKSAAQNVEKEIPKMGSAIGGAIKKMTEKGGKKTSSQEPMKQEK